MATAADPRCDLGRSQPVVVGLDADYPSFDAGMLDVEDAGDYDILHCRCFAVDVSVSGPIDGDCAVPDGLMPF